MISIFYPPYSFGGDAVYLSRLPHSLAERGHEVDVVHCIYSYRVSGSKPQEQEFPNHPAVTLHGLKSCWGLLSPLLSQQTGRPLLKTEKLRAILLSKKFDVIHFHNISLFGPGVLTFFFNDTASTEIYTMHEHW